MVEFKISADKLFSHLGSRQPELLMRCIDRNWSIDLWLGQVRSNVASNYNVDVLSHRDHPNVIHPLRLIIINIVIIVDHNANKTRQDQTTTVCAILNNLINLHYRFQSLCVLKCLLIHWSLLCVIIFHFTTSRIRICRLIIRRGTEWMKWIEMWTWMRRQ